jgi:hypothetical protein
MLPPTFLSLALPPAFRLSTSLSSRRFLVGNISNGLMGIKEGKRHILLQVSRLSL